MCFLSIESSDPTFDAIVRKNRDEAMISANVRNGIVYGYYDITNKNRYVCYFDDNPLDKSYIDSKQGNKSYINSLQYMSPVCVLDIINAMFSPLLNSVDNNAEDAINKIEVNHKFIINLVKMTERSLKYVTMFSTYTTDTITLLAKFENIYQVTIESTQSLSHMTNLIYILFAIISITNNDNFYCNKFTVKQIASSIEITDVPYFVRYLFTSKFITNNVLFEFVKEQLNSSHNNTYNFRFGCVDTQISNYIEKYLNYKNDIIDIGNNKIRNMIFNAQKLIKNSYIYNVICNDDTTIDILQKKAQSYDLTNIKQFPTLDVLADNIKYIINVNTKYINNVKQSQIYDILITNTIEHVDVDNRVAFINMILNNFQFNEIIMTVPNKSFSCFIDNESNVGLTVDEIIHTMSNISDKHKANIKYKIVAIGNTVDDINMLFAVHITKI